MNHTIGINSLTVVSRILLHHCILTDFTQCHVAFQWEFFYFFTSKTFQLLSFFFLSFIHAMLFPSLLYKNISLWKVTCPWVEVCGTSPTYSLSQWWIFCLRIAMTTAGYGEQCSLWFVFSLSKDYWNISSIFWCEPGIAGHTASVTLVLKALV